MEHQLIEHHTAVLAKEKGFDIPCKNYWVHWHHNEKMHITQGIEYNECDCDCFHEDYVEFDWNNNTEMSKQIRAPYPNEYHKSQASAPTQEQLAKWLREEHNLVVETSVDYKNISENQNTVKAVGYSSIVNVVKFNEIISVDDMVDNMHVVADRHHEKYEDAREVGLQYALKLIGK